MPVALVSSKNTGAKQEFTFNIDNVADLTPYDYELTYNSGWSAKNVQTGETVALTVGGDGSSGNPWVIEGIPGITASITGSAPSDGDKFLIRPTAEAADDLGMNLVDPLKVAAASPLIVEAANTNGLPDNDGTGKITGLSVSRTEGYEDSVLLPLGSMDLEYDETSNIFEFSGGYTVFDESGADITATGISYNPATDNGKSYTLTVDDGTGPPSNRIDVTFTITGTPEDGDRFTIADSDGNVSDNGNALLLGDVQTAKSLNGGTASLQSSYGQLVADVGIKTRQAQINSEAEQTLLRQAETVKDSLSGVNLDEEAANLIKFQQAYQASAQVIMAANSMFQALLGAVR